ncbi:MAG TPA: AsmA family protein [Rubrivivax sp.]|nr:AsmA family protein [Rubrivivax sp.]
MPISSRWPRWGKLLAGVLAAVVLLLAAAWLALRWAFPPERLSALLSSQVAAATGRSFELRGPLAIRVLPRLGISAADVALGNAPWGTRPDMLRVQQARFDVELLPLLRGQVEVASARFDGVDLWLETDRHGVGNWVPAPAGREAPQRDRKAPPSGREPGAGYELSLSRLELHDAKAHYRDGRSGASREFALDSLLLDDEGEGQRLDVRLASGAQRLQLGGRIGRVTELARNDADWPFDLQLGGDGLQASAKGLLRGGAAPRPLQAHVALQLSDAGALAAWVGPLPALPLPVEARGRLSLAGSVLQADELQLTLAQQTLAGKLSLHTGTPWKLDAQLAADSLDLDRWLAPRAGTAAAAAKAPAQRRVFGDQPLGLDKLPAAHAALSLRVERLQARSLPPLSALKLQLELQPGRLRAEPLSFGIAGGTLNGSLALSQAAGAPPRVALRAQSTNLSLDELLRAAGSSGYASGGRLQVRADLQLSGNTPRALAAGANGELLLTVDDTTLGQGASPLGTGVLRRLLQALTLRPGLQLSSRIDCAVLRLPLKNGVAAVDRSIALETAQLAVSAKGQLRLDDETLALAFTPVPKQGLKTNPLDLARLVVLEGPWSNPKVQLDAQGLVGMAASLGLAGATGGASRIAQQLLQAKRETETDACRIARSGAGAGAAAAAAPAPPAQAPRPAVVPGQLPQALPDVLRRILK